MERSTRPSGTPVTSELDRRTLLGAMAAGVAAATVAESVSGAEPSIELKSGDTILFQGDSITDAGRSRNAGGANNGRAMGSGYPILLGSQLLKDHRDKALKVFNRGISGNKVPDLEARWKADCLDLNPSVLSILIGVNDIWHKRAGRYDGTVKQYEEGFLKLVQSTLEALPSVRIVICEPFVLRCGAITDEWFPEFDERRAAAATVARETKSLWVPFQSMFDAAVKAGTEPAYWAGDGVHPSMAGHALMAETWTKVTGL
ncbi:MAG: lysophospholipase [Planctomycetales bacterium]|nr:lysophospholipase [Planctomycetales bacterium]